MDDPPEPLRLFDPILLDANSSQLETVIASLRNERRRAPSQMETGGQVVGSELLLHVLSEAGGLVENACRQLDAAIEAARGAGCSWREIGITAGVPYQTLHRRHRKHEE